MAGRWSTTERVPVWPATCATMGDDAPLGLGMVLSAIRWFDDGRLAQCFDLAPLALRADSVLDRVEHADHPGILLVSNYFWTLGANLDLANEVKSRSPDTIVVFGGPSAPKYEAEAAEFLLDHRAVDVLAREEGEITACELLDHLHRSGGDLLALKEVPGLTLRHDGHVLRTPDRERLTDPGVIPSPYLTGIFDHLDVTTGCWAVEASRGCPYGCTFCDWGAATMSRVRTFTEERVLAEFRWLAERGVDSVFVADANFGMFKRDLEIATGVADLHRQFGHPKAFIASFAKNTTKYTVPIVETLTSAGLMSEGTISFQTTDSTTLSNIRRKNIRLDAYRTLAEEARARGVPVLADIMIGLPGATIETLKSDLQICIENDVKARVFGTWLLPNSPMNEPTYRSEFEIGVDERDQVVSTYSYSASDRAQMVSFYDVFRIGEHFGVLRHVIRFVAAHSAHREIDVLWSIYRAAADHPGDYPLLAFFLAAARRYLTGPISWPWFYEEVGRFCRTEFGDLDALETVLTVQEALVPTPGRRYPLSVALRHDYLAWYQEQVRSSHGNLGRPLADYPPGTLVVDDPHGLAERGVSLPGEPAWTDGGHRLLTLMGSWFDDTHWELDSPLAQVNREHYFG